MRQYAYTRYRYGNSHNFVTLPQVSLEHETRSSRHVSIHSDPANADVYPYPRKVYPYLYVPSFRRTFSKRCAISKTFRWMENRDWLPFTSDSSICENTFDKSQFEHHGSWVLVCRLSISRKWFLKNAKDADASSLFDSVYLKRRKQSTLE